jgi:hypothetical protein
LTNLERRSRIRDQVPFAFGVVFMVVGFVLIAIGAGLDRAAGELPNPTAFWIGVGLFAFGAGIAWFGSRTRSG